MNLLLPSLQEMPIHEETDQETEEKGPDHHPPRGGSSNKSKASSSSSRTRGGSVETIPMEDMSQTHNHHNHNHHNNNRDEARQTELIGEKLVVRMNGHNGIVGIVDVHC